MKLTQFEMATALTPEELAVANGGLPRRAPGNPRNLTNPGTFKTARVEFFPVGLGRGRDGKWRTPWEYGEELWAFVERWVVQFVADQGSAR